ncbi:MAG: hypothetical protein AB1540_01500 [Bdellovibrionota bacterium]
MLVRGCLSKYSAFILLSLLVFVCSSICQAGPTRFETIIDENDGNIPTDFDQLVNLLNLYGNATAGLSGSLPIPDGRSLKKKEADYGEPRRIVVLESNASVPPSFVGLVPNAQELEVITWSQKSKRYEFLIVKDYAPGLRPKVIQADRQLCMSCHQAGGPIFTPRPWRETTENKAVETEVKKARLRAGKKLITVPNAEAAIFPEGKFPGDLIDSNVRIANRALQSVNVCTNLCKNNETCKKQLLYLGLLKEHSLDAKSIATLDQEFAEAVTGLWPSDNFSYPSSVLPDRDPLLDRAEGPTVFLKALKDRSNKTHNFSNPPTEEQLKPYLETYNEETAGVFSDDPKLSTITISGTAAQILADPKTPRPKVSSLVREKAASKLLHLLNSCFGFSDADFRYLNTLEPDEVKKIILKNPDEKSMKAILESWPPIGRKVMNFVRVSALKLRGTAANPEVCETDTPKKLTVQRIMDAIEDSSKRRETIKFIEGQFQKYCAQCHGGKDSDMPLPLESFEKMRNYTTEDLRPDDRGMARKLKVVDRLRGIDGRMPPGNADVLPTPEETEEMIEALEHLE